MALVNTTEAAKMLGVSRQAVHDAYKAGRLKASGLVTVPRRRDPAPVFDVAEVERYAATSRRKASA
jgi:DNA-binding FadR family transcriptional regulator